MLIHLLLVFTSVAHWGSIAWTQKYDDQHHDLIYVKDCQDRFVDIYSDKELTIPLPNPFVSENDGRYLYWSSHPYEKVTIIHWNEMTTVNTCRDRK